MSPFKRFRQNPHLLFFGRDARPISEVVMRRHPLAIAMYAVVFLLGLIFVLHWYSRGVSEKDLFPGVSPWAIDAWKWMMVSGGGGGLVCLLTRPRSHPHWPDLSDLLHLEGIAAVVGGAGMAVYMVVIINLMGFHDSGPAMVLYGTVVAGHLFRAWQAIYDATRLQTLAQTAQDHAEARDAELA